jgi:uncharacterized membrane protein
VSGAVTEKTSVTIGEKLAVIAGIFVLIEGPFVIIEGTQWRPIEAD